MIVIVPNSLSTIAEYYRTYSTDAAWVGDLTFQARDVISAPIATFADLLGVLSRAVEHGENKFLIVSHGSQDELYLPIVKGSPMTTSSAVLNQLADYARGNAGLQQSLLSPDWDIDGRKTKIFANAGQLDQLVSLLRKIQGARLAEVHFRACRVGAGAALAALASALGARHTSGPVSWYVYYWRSTGNLPATGTSAASISDFSRTSYPRRIYTRDECLLPFDSSHGGDEPALALSTVYGPDNKPNIAKIEAISQTAIQGFTRNFLEDSQYYPFGARAPGGGYRLGNRLIVFGVSNPGGDDNPVLFPGDGMDYLNQLAVINQ